MDTTIIEHLACLEVNKCILQKPFHLISNVQWNDKGVSFDGDITLYNSHEIKKENFEGIVPIQIKGTTTHKKSSKKNKIKHLINKQDLEVYYKHGSGVIYFVVTINPKTQKSQTYYNTLAPLNLKALLNQLEVSGKNSITVQFKKLEESQLETICRMFLKLVEKQPKNYIDISEKHNFKEYKINYTYLKQDSNFNIFEEQAYIYGVMEDIDIPVRAAKVHELRIGNIEEVELENGTIQIEYIVRETETQICLDVEKSLSFEFNKETKKGKVNLEKLKSINSYLKCLKIIQYLYKHDKLPLSLYNFHAKLNEQERFSEIGDEIKQYEELNEVCKSIGICEEYIFDENEDISILFNSIIGVFKNKEYSLINQGDGIVFDNLSIHNLKLSDYITISLIYDETESRFINFFTEEALKKIGGFMPKGEVVKEFNNGNWQENYWKTSIYSTQNIEDMNAKKNFNFDVLKLSFQNEYHDRESDQNIDIALKFIAYYDKKKDIRYLELALNLLQDYLKVNSQDTIALINLYQIKVRQNKSLSDDEASVLLDILGKKEGDKTFSFACEVLLGDRRKAKRIFESIEQDLQNNLMKYPIYNLYQMME